MNDESLKFSYTTSYKEIIQGLKIVETAGNRSKKYLFILLNICIMVSGIYMMFYKNQAYGTFIFCMGLYLFVRKTFGPILRRRSIAKKIIQKGVSYEIEFGSIEMFLYIGTDKITIPYRNVYVRDTPKMLIIINNSSEMIAVPKQYLGEKEQLVTYILKNNIGSRYIKL